MTLGNATQAMVTDQAPYHGVRAVEIYNDTPNVTVVTTSTDGGSSSSPDVQRKTEDSFEIRLGEDADPERAMSILKRAIKACGGQMFH
jgi:hypothetical protein